MSRNLPRKDGLSSAQCRPLAGASQKPLGPWDSGKQEVLKMDNFDFPTSEWRDRETAFEGQNYSIGLM